MLLRWKSTSLKSWLSSPYSWRRWLRSAGTKYVVQSLLKLYDSIHDELWWITPTYFSWRRRWCTDNLQVAQVALAYNHFETASNSVLLTCSRIVKKNQESRAPLQFPQEDGALVAHLLSIEEPVCCEVFNCFSSDHCTDGKLNPGWTRLCHARSLRGEVHSETKSSNSPTPEPDQRQLDGSAGPHEPDSCRCLVQNHWGVEQ